jgi:hypothetical protein
LALFVHLFLSAASLQALALSCEDTAEDCADLDRGVLPVIDVRFVANMSDIIATPYVV